ncbi:Gfo/Idh/MocA family oxidoreductase [Pseudonocardia kujensis]|uniref:Gfo/Idh/MocA family protein n=1 Tax=Pseudonocardia kujensis TaxID=1128675 RepID=UPI001E578218|nr:Gfo/Idh/MocA family oxidoreductase [Pseudonocardia kujensis]MCE0763605.1 Gfo/Idh/MocA family oxidoreductase [Pseudonocardia kujensis]
MNALRVAVVGPGRIAVAHLDAITAASDVARLVAVAGLPTEHDRTQALAARFGAERTEDDVRSVAAAQDIDAVVLTVPNHLHAPLATELLAAGKHVLVEKPLATTAADADLMIDAAARHDRTLMVAQCRRFFRGAQLAKERMTGLGGPVTVVHHLGVFAEGAAAGWWRSAADTGGLAIGLNGPHVVDTMTWLIGAEPVRVYARTRRLRDHWEGEDEAVLVIDYADGSLGTGYLSVNARVPVNDRWITGPDATLRLTDDRTLHQDGTCLLEEPVTPYIEGDSAFRAQFREFADAVLDKREPLASAREVRSVSAVLEAALRSADTGLPVDLA